VIELQYEDNVIPVDELQREVKRLIDTLTPEDWQITLGVE
jgi:hypothetical protein